MGSFSEAFSPSHCSCHITTPFVLTTGLWVGAAATSKNTKKKTWQKLYETSQDLSCHCYVSSLSFHRLQKSNEGHQLVFCRLWSLSKLTDAILKDSKKYFSLLLDNLPSYFHQFKSFVFFNAAAKVSQHYEEWQDSFSILVELI